MSRDEKLAKMQAGMAKALDDVVALLVPGAPYKATIFLRNERDPEAHMLVGGDTLDGILQGIAELAINDPKARREDGTEVCVRCHAPLLYGHCANCDPRI